MLVVETETGKGVEGHTFVSERVFRLTQGGTSAGMETGRYDDSVAFRIYVL